MKETQQSQPAGVMAESEKQDDHAFEPEKPKKSNKKQQQGTKKNSNESKKGPEGGYDDTPIPRREVHTSTPYAQETSR